jgi:flagellar FliJ protein
MAKRFEFSLETVLRLRRQDNDAQRRVMAEALRGLRQAEIRVKRVEQEISDQTAAVRGEQGVGTIDVAAVRGHQFYMTRLHAALRTSQMNVTAARAVVDAERGKLAETSKRLKVIEKLRERRYQRYTQEAARRDRIDEDEVALNLVRLARRSAEVV